MNEYIIELPELGEITVDFETGPEFTIEATGVPGPQGDPGDPGVSPTVTVTDIPSGHRVTITDATGEHSFDVMDGQDGGVTDVQVNGTSVVTDGVANVPVASGSELGVVRIPSVGSTSVNASGEIDAKRATTAIIKTGTAATYLLTVQLQQYAAFYGLAKAAGADMANVSGATVGVYPEAQKSAIRKMLGIGQWEIIKTVTLGEDAASVVINTDTNDQSFKLRELAFVASFKPSSSTTQNSNCYVRIDPYNYITNATGIIRTSATGGSGHIRPIVTATSSTEGALSSFNIASSNGSITWNGKNISSLEHSYCEYFELYTTGTPKFGTGTVITLFGIRA